MIDASLRPPSTVAGSIPPRPIRRFGIASRARSAAVFLTVYLGGTVGVGALMAHLAGLAAG